MAADGNTDGNYGPLGWLVAAGGGAIWLLSRASDWWDGRADRRKQGRRDVIAELEALNVRLERRQEECESRANRLERRLARAVGRMEYWEQIMAARGEKFLPWEHDDDDTGSHPPLPPDPPTEAPR